MKQIYLFCYQGVSTGILVNRMNKYIQQRNYPYMVNAYPISKAIELADKADYILIAPQVSFEYKYLKEKLTNKYIKVLSPVMYGLMDGKAIVEIIHKEDSSH